MLNTIEQKLSTIKAINERKDAIDSALTSLMDTQLNPGQLLTLNWKNRTVIIPHNVQEDIILMIAKSYGDEKQQLIEKAADLMTS